MRAESELAVPRCRSLVNVFVRRSRFYVILMTYVLVLLICVEFKYSAVGENRIRCALVRLVNESLVYTSKENVMVHESAQNMTCWCKNSPLRYLRSEDKNK